MTNSSSFFPERVFAAGYTDLLPVVPTGAQLTPTSKIPVSAIGKVPGRKLPSGLWAGFDWRRSVATAESVRAWCLEGASTGIRADNYPALDIDCHDEDLATMIEQAAIAQLGKAPIRYGRRPKRLLVYRTDEPFGRMRMWIKTKDDSTNLIEILGMGQQYVIDGIHPFTERPYEWTVRLPKSPTELVTITRESATKFLDEMATIIEMSCYGTTEREGDGRPVTRIAGEQAGLLAPTVELLTEAVTTIPNSNDIYPSRQAYLKIGHAIKAAAGPDFEHEGRALFLDWAARWDGNDRFAINDPEVAEGDWERMRGPYLVGWQFIAEQARAFGFNDAALEFGIVEPTEANPDKPRPPMYSDQWLALNVIDARTGELRFVPQKGHWVVWNKGKWEPDAELAAESIVFNELNLIADKVIRGGGTPSEKKEAMSRSIDICSAGKASSVRTVMAADRNIAVSLEALDRDPWVINTPNGIVDLKTGEVGPANPDALCTKSTSVVADFTSETPEWNRFINEATHGDAELINYLQRLCGYALTGSTREHSIAFFYGDGGNGKGVFMNVLNGIMHDYANQPSMDTFTASVGDKHTTDIAMLHGARLVSASETQAGKRWDEAKLKSLSGGDPVTARFMRQDNFTFVPQFKLIFMGNHRPEIRDVDAAMRRRIQMVPFNATPKVIDMMLGDKLREEWPAIFAWMIRGCIEWQRLTLSPPASVQASTNEYFREEDAVGKWMNECLERSSGFELSTTLFNSWREWANTRGEFVGSMKRLSGALAGKKLEKVYEAGTRRAGYSGYKVIDRQQLGVI